MNSPALSCSLVLQSRFWQRRSGAKMLRVEGSARCGGVPQGSGACQGQGNRKGRRGAGRCWQARDARAGSTIQARTSRRGGRRPVATRTPRTIGTRAAQVRGCTSQCFCVPHFTGAAAAETLPQRHQQTTHSSRQHGLRPLATEAEAAVAAEARFSRAARLGTQRPQVLRGLRAAERFEFRVLRDRGFM